MMEDTEHLAFDKAFNEIAQLYDDDKLEECIEKAKELLEDTTLPDYHRMRTLIVLGSIIGDWFDADMYCVKADYLWQMIRRRHRVGANEKFDQTLQEARDSIDELQEVLETEEHEGYEYDTEEEEYFTGQVKNKEASNAIAEAEAGDGEELPIRAAPSKGENEQEKLSGGGSSSSKTR